MVFVIPERQHQAFFTTLGGMLEDEKKNSCLQGAGDSCQGTEKSASNFTRPLPTAP